ncbi:MAG: sulfite exporter TauE/SafE family protein [Oscillospiraceae bacterium]|nr:sulfite exporter TauE/SafE family protein [Oscillospiraceae bacterium]
MKKPILFPVAGVAAGLINGLFGGGGGMVLLPALLRGGVPPKKAFATCVALILPLCLVSAAVMLLRTEFDWMAALPYLIGGAIGGLAGGKLFRKVSPQWLKGLFAIFMIYGGVRYLL